LHSDEPFTIRDIKKDRHFNKDGGLANLRVAGLPGLSSGMSTDHPASGRQLLPNQTIFYQQLLPGKEAEEDK
jgi:hypothetical protein